MTGTRTRRGSRRTRARAPSAHGRSCSGGVRVPVRGQGRPVGPVDRGRGPAARQQRSTRSSSWR
eukprot:789614-Prymnesium_polylepis.1